MFLNSCAVKTTPTIARKKQNKPVLNNIVLVIFIPFWK